MGAHLFEFPERRALTLVLPDPGRRRLRMIFRYRESLRAMCWLSVGSDGSLYFNQFVATREKLTQAEAIADGKGGWTETTVPTEVRIDQLEDAHPKISQHASGVVKHASFRSKSVSFRDVNELTLVRQDDYRHPSHYREVAEGSLRVADIPVPAAGGDLYTLDESRPLTSRLFVAPLREGNANVSLVEEDEVAAQTSVVVPATNLKNCPDLTFQLVFWNHSPRAWPDMATSGILDVPDTPV